MAESERRCHFSYLMLGDRSCGNDGKMDEKGEKKKTEVEMNETKMEKCRGTRKVRKPCPVENLVSRAA